MSKQSLLIWICILLISLSGIVINWLKKGNKSNVQSFHDDGTLQWFRILILSALGSSIVFYLLKIFTFQLPLYCTYLAVAMVFAGLFIRWCAVLQLGNAFTTKVALVQDHQLQTRGMYYWVRHPSYTGLLLYYFGLGVLMLNWAALFLLILLPGIAVWQRIKVEEEVLLRHFDNEYSDYQKNSWKLIPFLF